MLFDSQFKKEFEDIRCYDDSEVSKVLATLKDHGESLFSLISQEAADLSKLFKQTTVRGLQAWLKDNIAPQILERTTAGLSIKGLESLNPQNNYIFISNHRDIAMDPLVVNIALLNSQFETAHTAIGDNLLISPISQALACLNKCFRVNRSQKSPKAMLKALKHQSNYISKIYHEQQGNIWIAQREGRSIDNTDLTNPALLKMLSLSADPSDRTEALAQFKIVPVSISYEWDPCDFGKALRLSRSISGSISGDSEGTNSKSKQDYQDVVDGLSKPKGRINVCFSSPLDINAETQDTADLYKSYAKAIDQFLHANYTLYPNNYAASKILSSSNAMTSSNRYGISQDEIDNAELLLRNRLEAYGLKESDPAGRALLQLYAANLRNKDAQ